VRAARRRDSAPTTGPAVKTSGASLPPRSADRAVGGTRTGVVNSGRRASTTNDSTPIPTIRRESQEFVAWARGPPCTRGRQTRNARAAAQRGDAGGFRLTDGSTTVFIDPFADMTSLLDHGARRDYRAIRREVEQTSGAGLRSPSTPHRQPGGGARGFMCLCRASGHVRRHRPRCP
jgi:hypothetical protein